MNRLHKHPAWRSATIVALATGLTGAGLGGQANLESRWLPYFLEANALLPTYGATVAVDRQGGLHAAYSIYAGVEGAKRPAIYAYCPANPGNPSNWTFTPVGEAVQDARLALDPEGRPRLLLFGPVDDPETPFRTQYQYAECNSGWTEASNWSLTTIVRPIEAVATREENNNRYFAISSQGVVAFVYTDTSDNHHPGTFYMSCRTNPRIAANWTETTLTSAFGFDKPSLAFSLQGKPRLAFGLYADDGLYLGYGESDGDGTDPDQWTYVIITPMHGSAMYSLQVDRGGYPRLAFSSGSFASAPFTDHQLYYLWCTNGATADILNWNYHNVGIYQTVGGVDLALDGHDRPRVSYLASQGLGYAKCDVDAESDEGVWEQQLIESNNSLAENYEVLPIRRCTASAWINGQRNSLALDESGRPYFAYDAHHVWSGVETDPPYGDCYFEDITVARLSFPVSFVSPLITIRQVGTRLEIAFEQGVLESAEQPDGPWSTLAGATSPWLAAPEGMQRFYRVRQ